MLKKVLETIGIRYLVAALNFLLIMINGKVLGVAGMGLVGVVYASANLALIFTSVLCSNTIVYFMNRYHYKYVLFPAYIWSFVGSALACGMMVLFGMIPDGFLIEVYVLSVLLSLVAVNTRGLLGKDQINGFNLSFLIQGGGLFLTVLIFYFVLNRRNPEDYIQAVLITNGIAWIISSLLLVRTFRKYPDPSKEIPSSYSKLMKEMFVYGLWGSADNLAEGLVTRLNYFLIQHLGGFAQVGLLDAGTKVSESVWHISRSVSFISYRQIVKMTDPELQRLLALRFFRLTYLAIGFIMAIIVCIPEWVYTEILFSHEFQGIREVICGLSLGIIALGANSIFSHYFIATGRVRYSTFSSCTGLVALLISGSLLIPTYGVTGAAVSTSIAFSGMLTFSLIAFRKLTGTKVRDFFPLKEDFEKFFKRKSLL